MTRFEEIPLEDRPREKLIRVGAMALTDHELLAVLLGSGTKGCDVLTLAKRVLTELDTHRQPSPQDLVSSIPGLGPAKAGVVLAALEFSRRRIAPDGVRIREPADVIPLIRHLADRKQETFVCVSLNGAHEIIATRIVTIGLVNLCQVHPREVFADPITDRACAVVVAHNHPSGDLTPSREDLNVTQRLKDAALILGIKLLDHIIFSQRGFYSIECGR